MFRLLSQTGVQLHPTVVSLPQNDAESEDYRQNKETPKNWHVFASYTSEFKKQVMKQVFERLVKKEHTGEKFHLPTAVLMILLFLTFWGVSFYVLVNSFA